MCGRYALFGPKSRSRAEKDLSTGELERILRFVREYLKQAAPRYNIAPQQGEPRAYVPIIRRNAAGALELTSVQWWLLPFWSKEPRVPHATFNARIETAAKLPSFREAFRKRRCLIPASGWFEWQELPGGNLPWYIHPVRDEVALFAGLWDRWERDGQAIESCSIIVGPANEAVQQFQDRMPYTVSEQNLAAWLDPQLQDADAVAKLLEPFPPAALTAHRVGKRVNSARNNDETLLEPEESA